MAGYSYTLTNGFSTIRPPTIGFYDTNYEISLSPKSFKVFSLLPMVYTKCLCTLCLPSNRCCLLCNTIRPIYESLVKSRSTHPVDNSCISYDIRWLPYLQDYTMVKVSLIKYHLPSVGDIFYRSAFWFLHWNHISVKLEAGKETIYLHGWFGSNKPPYWLNQKLEDKLFMVKKEVFFVGYTNIPLEYVFTYVATLGSIPKAPFIYSSFCVLTGLWLPLGVTCTSIARDVINFIFKNKLKHSYSPEGLTTEIRRKKHEFSRHQ